MSSSPGGSETSVVSSEIRSDAETLMVGALLVWDFLGDGRQGLRMVAASSMWPEALRTGVACYRTYGQARLTTGAV